MISGTNLADVLIGTGGDDLIEAAGGDDVVRAGNGNDVVKGGDGNDRINAGAGDDHVNAGKGDDAVIGGLGNDRILGAGGDDTLSGGEGNDTLSGGAGRDKFFFSPAGGVQRDVIKDFEPDVDVIEIDEMSIVKAVQDGAHVVITLSTGAQVVVENTAIGSLGDKSFNEGIEADFYVGAVELGVPVTGTIAPRPKTLFDETGAVREVHNDANPGASRYHSFDLLDGESVAITVTSVGDRFDPAIWILRDKVNLDVGKFGLFFDPGDRNVLATAGDESGGGADDGTTEATFTADRSGTYSVVVTDAGSAPQTPADLLYAYELLIV